MKPSAALTLTVATALPLAAGAQSITVAPALAPAPGVAAIPVDNPLALVAMGVALLAAAWFVLRNRQHRALFMALWGGALMASLLWHSPELRAQLVNSFTNPAGETQPIAVNQVNAGASITGFVPVDFTNSSGVPLKITALQEPTLPQCFPAGFGLLAASGAAPVSPPVCAVGNTIAPAGVCRVSVETICRAEAAAAPQTTLSLSAATLAFDAGASEVLTVTNTGTQTADNVRADIPAGSGITLTPSTCGSMAPGASCNLTVESSTVGGPTAVRIYGDNAMASTVNVTVNAAPITEVGAFALRGTCGTLGLLGPGFTMQAGPTVPLPVGTTVTITGSGVPNIGVFSVSGGTANVAVLSNTSRQITLTSALPAGATIAFRTTLSISVAFQLNAVATLPGGYSGSGAKTAGNVSSTLILCSAN